MAPLATESVEIVSMIRYREKKAAPLCPGCAILSSYVCSFLWLVGYILQARNGLFEEKLAEKKNKPKHVASLPGGPVQLLYSHKFRNCVIVYINDVITYEQRFSSKHTFEKTLGPSSTVSQMVNKFD